MDSTYNTWWQLPYQYAAQQQHPFHRQGLQQIQSQTQDSILPPGEFDSHCTPDKSNGHDIYRRHDSWQSYPNEGMSSQPQALQWQGQVPFQTQFQPPAWNVMAPSFTPVNPAPQKPLSSPSGAGESAGSRSGRKKDRRRAQKMQNGLLQANVHANNHLSDRSPDQTLQYSTGVGQQYSAARSSGLADFPIPSIEPLTIDPSSSQKNKKKGIQNLPSRSRRSKTRSPEPPAVSVEYLTQASKPSERLSSPRKLLVVLDLNGTLLYRAQSANASGTKKVHMRPGVTALLDYLFTNHLVMVYTSAMPKSAANMLDQFMHPRQRSKLAAVWARDRLDLTADQFKNKVQVYKKLDKIWADPDIQKSAPPGTQWDQSNTVLVDDSMLKAKAQPHNLVAISEYTVKDKPSGCKNSQKRLSQVQQDVMKHLQMKLDELAICKDVSTLISRWQDGSITPPQLAGQQNVVTKIPDHEDQGTEHISSHLPTPDTQQENKSDNDDSHYTSQDDQDAGAPLSPVSEVDEDAFSWLRAPASPVQASKPRPR